MKSLTLRSCVAIACAIGLLACGGKGGNLILAGTVSGLNRTGLVLQNNGAHDLAIVAGSVGFQFPDLIGNDTDYEVTVKLPQPAGEVCTVLNGKGRTGLYSPNNIVISCVPITHQLGGTFSGLTGIGLTLANGSDVVTLDPQASSNVFVFPKQVADGAPYGVTVLQQPFGQSCTVSRGVGTMGTADIVDAAGVLVSCH